MTLADTIIATIGLPSHPSTRSIARTLRDVARLLDADGPKAETAARTLAARGFPTGTLGDGTGSRSTSSSTSTERAAHVDDPQLRPGDYDGADQRLATLLRLAWQTCLTLQTTIPDLLAHAEDLDPVPVGTGFCECCGRFCRPSEDKPNERLRSGFCNACRMAWTRALAEAPLTGVNRADWIHARQHLLREGTKGRCERCDQPWTPETEHQVAS